MIDTFTTLLSPLKYLKATNDHKFSWDWTIPVIMAIIGTVCVWVLPKPIALLGDKGLVYWVNGLLQMLVGFYIAALAAVASFDRASLDQVIEGEGVSLYVWRDGEHIKRSLTRRAFISLMFGYLAWLAIALYCAGLAVSVLHENIALLVPALLDSLRLAFVFIYGFFFSQMLCITLVALFYLSDRIHRQTPTALPPEDIVDDKKDGAGSGTPPADTKP